MKKNIFIIILIAATTAVSFAQVKIGANPTVLSTNASLEVEATNGTRVFIDKTTGNTGIGITAPVTRFHVAGVVGGAAARIEHAGGGGNTGDALQAGINNCGGPCGQGTGRNLVMYNSNGTNSDFASLDFVPSGSPSGASGASIQGIDRDGTNNYAGLNFITRNSTNYASRMVIKSSGNVGIGTTAPTATLHVVGTTLASAWSTSSDARLKTKIEALPQGTLQKVMAMKPLSYLKKDALASTEYKNQEIGFIAQDLKMLFPMVITENGDDKLLSVNYTALIPVLTKAMQEQQAQIEALKKENMSLKVETAKVKDLETQMSSLNNKLDLLLKTNQSSSNNTSLSGSH
jgi:Chaperone of endosialidase